MTKHRVVFLFDVDNTLLDNDRVTADLRRHLGREVGQEGQQRYFRIFEELRSELGYADYLGALQRYRIENPHDPNLLTVSYFLSNYQFANRLYPNSLDVVEHCKQWGPTVILSDGDVVFQPRKVDRSGLLEIFEKNGGSEDGFDQYLYENRVKHARTIDSFAAEDYEGNKHESKDLMGKVTLVAFWFPT